MDVNVRGYFLYAQAAYPYLARRRGCMIHIASDAGIWGEQSIGLYSVSKAAVVMLGKMLALKGGPDGVRSNVLCPGFAAGRRAHVLSWGHICHLGEQLLELLQFVRAQSACEFLVEVRQPAPAPNHTALALVRWPQTFTGSLRGAGNNGPVSTAKASSFLNCPGGAVARGALAWPERVVGVAGPLADLASLVSLGLPGVPGPLQLRGRGSGQPPSGAEGPELQVRLGQPPTAFGPRVGQHRSGVQVLDLDPPGPGEFVHVGGDPVDDRGHPRQADSDDGPVRPVGGRAQVDRRRVAAPDELPQPARALPQPAHLIDEPVSGQLAAVKFRVVMAIGVFRGRPARRPQLTQRRVQLIEVGGGHDLVHPRGREPGRGGERADGHALGARRRQRPAALPFGLPQPPRRPRHP